MKIVNKIDQSELQSGINVPLIEVREEETGFVVALAVFETDDEAHIELCDAIGAIIMTVAEKFELPVKDVMKKIHEFVSEAEEFENARSH